MKLRVICSSSHRLRFFCSSLSAYSFFGFAVAQDALPDLPSGFYEFTAGVIGEEEEQHLGNLNLGLRLRALYDTNVTQGNEIGPRPQVSDFLVQPTLAGSYQIDSGNWRSDVTGTYGRINYLETDDFNTNVYSAGWLARYETGKITASVKTAYAKDAGLNTLAGAFIEQRNFSNLAKIDYRFSSKTSAEILWKQQSIKTETEGFADISSNTFNAAALWQATPLVRIGPGFRYGVRTGFEDSDFTVAGPVLRADYKLSTKVNLTSTVGLDSTDSLFQDEELFNWRVGLTYRASALWSVNLQMARDTDATFISGGGFDQISNYRLAYTRKIRRANLQLGVAYVDREPQDFAGVALGFRDLNSVNYTASVSFPIIGDEVYLGINLAWRNTKAADNLLSWDAFQSGVSLAWQF